MDFQIGELVKWEAGGNKVYGAVLEDKGSEVTIITHKVRGIITNREVTVKKELLTLAIN